MGINPVLFFFFRIYVFQYRINWYKIDLIMVSISSTSSKMWKVKNVKGVPGRIRKRAKRFMNRRGSLFLYSVVHYNIIFRHCNVSKSVCVLNKFRRANSLSNSTSKVPIKSRKKKKLRIDYPELTVLREFKTYDFWERKCLAVTRVFS